ncbi:MAG: DMT family transporter [Chloroflexi bacterium]|nr:DMT family transporter [Chloroflexota bacterium]MCY3937633.1 DMT family transporter [Chloroflexota bacterium]
MTEAAIGLVLASAVLHSTWNYMAKRSTDNLLFLWLAAAAGLVLFTPAFILVVQDNPVPLAGWVFIGLSSVVHVMYFVLLGGAYSRTDLSVVYPLARGTGPIFVLVLSIAILRELPSLLGLLGILAVVVGVYLIQASALTFNALGAPLRAIVSSGSRWALLTGLTIGLYSIIDSAGVRHVHPLVYMYLWSVGTFAIIAPWMAPRVRKARGLKREAVWIFAAGALMFGAYVLVLTALQTSSVSYVAAARETSIVFAAIYGGLLLREGVGPARILGACLVASGVALIGIAG